MLRNNTVLSKRISNNDNIWSITEYKKEESVP
jgi:hypothetical protein